MKKVYSAILISAILMVFVFSSCISIERTIKLEDDGSGNEITTLRYGRDFFDYMKSLISSIDSSKGNNFKNVFDSILNTNLQSSKMKEEYKKLEGITVNSVNSKYMPDSSLVIKIDYNFDNIIKLTKSHLILNEGIKSYENGKTEIVFKKDGKKIFFHYKYDMGSVSDSTKSIRNTLAPFFKDQKMIFNITFPYSIVNSNAIKTHGKTLIWEYDMEKMLSEGFSVNLKAEIKK